jgi:lipoic acid synthetase
MQSSLARQLALPARPVCADPGRRDRSGSLRCRAEAAPPVSVSRTGPYTGRDPEVKKPAWLRQRAAHGEKYARMRETLGELKLNTVCVEAQCPNIGEVYTQLTTRAAGIFYKISACFCLLCRA